MEAEGAETVAMLQIGKTMATTHVEAGAALRDRRRKLGWTLTAVAARTGISTGTLSRLETNKLQPNLNQLVRLAAAYSCSLDELVQGEGRAVTLPAFTRNGAVFVPLARPAKGLHIFKVTAPAARPGEPPTLCAHDGHIGHQWIYVLSGSLRVVLGSDSYVVTEGESTEFDTRLGHSLAGTEGHAVEAIMVFGPEGQRQRVLELGRQWTDSGAPRDRPSQHVRAKRDKRAAAPPR